MQVAAYDFFIFSQCDCIPFSYCVYHPSTYFLPVIFLSVSGGQWKAFSEAVLHASVVLYENIHSMVYLRRKQMFLTCQKYKNTLSW